jgi:NADH dehydrogenase [ubiquinone] 1 alpha subcomplex assembly factor 7
VIERLDHFMARANAAYYATHNPFADFTTAPEISQIFGELIGLWAALVWQAMGAPSNVLLVEAGPGRGTLMLDALRAIGRAAPDFAAALSLHFIETSPRLITLIKSVLPESSFHTDLATIPDQPLILLANEFLDALPIRLFVRQSGGWLERHVDDDKPHDLPTDIVIPAEELGAIREFSPDAERFLATLTQRIMCHSGAALIIDYGPARSGPGETLQAIRHGKQTNPLINPGTADLTAHVNFEQLADIARKAGATIWGPTPQGAFLSALGIHERTNHLGAHASPEQALNLMAATRRLTAPEAMGSLFKAMAIAAPSLSPLPGFSP